MSERDDSYARWWEPIILFALLVILIMIGSLRDRGELRNLQRRIGQLEQAITPSQLGTRLPEVREIHWCVDCAAGIPRGKGSGAWLGRLSDGRYFCAGSKSEQQVRR